MQKLKDFDIHGHQKTIGIHKTSGRRIADRLMTDESGSPAYNRHQTRVAEEIRNCAKDMYMLVDTDSHKQRMTNTWFCRNALCPLCEQVRYNKDSARLFHVLDHIENSTRSIFKHPRYLFVTFTTRNVDGEHITNAIDELNKAWRKFKRYKAIEPYLQGTAKRIEISINHQDGTYHVHMHVLMLVKPSFYAGKNYLTYSSWSKLWSRALGDEYQANVNIVRLKDHEEVLKKMHYMLKVNEDITDIKATATDEEVDRIITADNAKYRKHLLTLSGVLKDIDNLVNAQYKRHKANKRDNNTGKHDEYKKPNDFDYKHAKLVKFSYIDTSEDYYRIE